MLSPTWFLIGCPTFSSLNFCSNYRARTTGPAPDDPAFRVRTHGPARSSLIGSLILGLLAARHSLRSRTRASIFPERVPVRCCVHNGPPARQRLGPFFLRAPSPTSRGVVTDKLARTTLVSPMMFRNQKYLRDSNSASRKTALSAHCGSLLSFKFLDPLTWGSSA